MEAQVNGMTDIPVRIEEADLYGLLGPERDAAIDALSNSKEFPFVIVGDRLACAGALDADAIAQAVEATAGG